MERGAGRLPARFPHDVVERACDRIDVAQRLVGCECQVPLLERRVTPAKAAQGLTPPVANISDLSWKALVFYRQSMIELP